MKELLNWQQKLFLPSYFGIYRMFLFKTDDYMLIIKLDSYTKSLLDMCSSPIKFVFFLRPSNLKAAMVESQFSSLDFCHQKCKKIMN